MPQAVIVAAARTAIGRATKGSLVTMRPDNLSALIIEAVLEKVPALDPTHVRRMSSGGALSPVERLATTWDAWLRFSPDWTLPERPSIASAPVACKPFAWQLQAIKSARLTL